MPLRQGVTGAESSATVFMSRHLPKTTGSVRSGTTSRCTGRPPQRFFQQLALNILFLSRAIPLVGWATGELAVEQTRYAGDAPSKFIEWQGVSGVSSRSGAGWVWQEWSRAGLAGVEQGRSGRSGAGRVWQEWNMVSLAEGGNANGIRVDFWCSRGLLPAQGKGWL